MPYGQDRDEPQTRKRAGTRASPKGPGRVPARALRQAHTRWEQGNDSPEMLVSGQGQEGTPTVAGWAPVLV